MRKEMKKLFVIALLWATISIFSAGCVDVGNPSGNPNDPNQNNPDGNGGNDGNDGNGGNDGDGNGGNDGNSTLDPDDPMYPGESGTYITNWANYSTTTTTQKYVGATYDDSNTANVPNTQRSGYESPAPYKTTFSDGTKCYSTGPFVDVVYTRPWNNSQTDSVYQGSALDGFVVVDYEYDVDKNKVFYREDPITVESTGNNSGKYITDDWYVTKQPVLKVPYQKSSSGAIYYGWRKYSDDTSDYTGDYLYATKWSDGSYTLSVYKFQDVEYAETSTTEFSYVQTQSYAWNAGSERSGRKESDYTFNMSSNEYQYTGGSNAAGGATAETGDPIEDLLEDAEDILTDILDNDGLRIQR
jgi:hypothetical protein